MKAKIYLFIIIIATGFYSCADYLDRLPVGDMTIDETFSNYKFADRFLANAYYHLPFEHNWADARADTRSPYVGGCDEMEIAYGGSYTHIINAGAWNPLNIGMIPVWTESYMGIRKLNIYLENIDRVPLPGSDEFTEAKRLNRKGEAYFLRALFYFHIARCHGPFVILRESLSPDEDFLSFKRATLEECINFIVSDCNEAIGLLPDNQTAENLGRPTKTAARAVKARLLLYYASPLWNGNPDYADFTDNEGVRLFPSEDLSRWGDAADAALECITEAEKVGYALYKKDADPKRNYTNIWMDKLNTEWIFWRNIKEDFHPDRCANPLSMGGFSILNPTQEMVDAYQMENGESPILGYNADGSPIINTASGYQEAGYAAAESPNGWYPSGIRNMYANREPRFYASINFNGQRWKGSTFDVWYTGKDGRNHAGSDFCKTGYLIRKTIDESINYVGWYGFSNMHCLYYRLGEMYLNYAEAINEAEGPSKAYSYVNAIRDRAGLPDLPTGLNKEQMREKIRQERRIELAFETHRFFDVRRWKTAENTENKVIHGMNIGAGNHLQDDAFYQRTEIEPRIFEQQHYLFPIPQSEINKTERNLVQNPEWSGDYTE